MKFFKFNIDKLSNENNKDERSSTIASDMNVNRNESFINTAAKLLERAKQQHQQKEQLTYIVENKEYASKTAGKVTTSQQSIDRTNNIFSIN